ncbi:MAG: hypothetical protein ACRDY1_03155 [Acidimicrobiales bacterium]
MTGVGILLAACGSSVSGSTLAAQVAHWATGASPTLAASVSAIQGDIRRIDGVGRDAGALPADCDLLVTDVLNANQNLPSPDEKLTGLLSAAYVTAGAAGHHCLSTSAAARSRSATERAQARRDLIRALARYDYVTTP